MEQDDKNNRRLVDRSRYSLCAAAGSASLLATGLGIESLMAGSEMRGLWLLAAGGFVASLTGKSIANNRSKNEMATWASYIQSTNESIPQHRSVRLSGYCMQHLLKGSERDSVTLKPTLWTHNERSANTFEDLSLNDNSIQAEAPDEPVSAAYESRRTRACIELMIASGGISIAAVGECWPGAAIGVAFLLASVVDFCKNRYTEPEGLATSNVQTSTDFDAE